MGLRDGRAGCPASSRARSDPAFQGVKWDDPSAFDRGARALRQRPAAPQGADGRWWPAAFGVLMAGLYLAFRRTRIARR